MDRRLSRPQTGKVEPGSAAKGESGPVPILPEGAPRRPQDGDPPATSWAVFAKDRGAERAWRELCAAMPGPCQRAYDQLAIDPYYEDGSRWIQLAGRFSGIRQHELAGGQRLWYRIEDNQRVVIVEPHAGHPKETERRNR